MDRQDRKLPPTLVFFVRHPVTTNSINCCAPHLGSPMYLFVMTAYGRKGGIGLLKGRLSLRDMR